MPVEMIGRKIGEDTNVRFQARHQVDLERGQFKHVDAVLHRLIEQEHRFADIAADFRVKACRLQHMADQRGGGRFAIGAGYADDPCTRHHGFARENLGVADDFNARVARLQHRPVRFGMGEWHTGTQHQCIEAGEIETVQVGDRQPLRPGFFHRRVRIIPGVNLRPAQRQGLDAGRAGACEAEHGDTFAFECAGGKHELPTSTSTSTGRSRPVRWR